MTSKYLEITSGEYINPAHIVGLKLIRDSQEPKTAIVAIEFRLVVGGSVTMSIADLGQAKEKLKASDIIL